MSPFPFLFVVFYPPNTTECKNTSVIYINIFLKVSSPGPPEDEIQWILNEVEKYLDDNVRVRRADVLSAWQGFRPLASDPHAPPDAPISRDHIISINQETGITFITGGTCVGVVVVVSLLIPHLYFTACLSFSSFHLSPSLSISLHLSPSLSVSLRLSPSLSVSLRLSPSLSVSLSRQVDYVSRNGRGCR